MLKSKNKTKEKPAKDKMMKVSTDKKIKVTMGRRPQEKPKPLKPKPKKSPNEPPKKYTV